MFTFQGLPLNEWLESILGIKTYLKMPTSGLVEFCASERAAPEEFSLFRKIFTPGYSGSKIK
jgi:hypothetical protein